MGNELVENVSPVNQPVGSSVNVNTPSKSRKNILILLCILLFIFIAGANLYLYQKQKTADKTGLTKSNIISTLLTEWKSSKYDSPEKDYKFNYPPNWKIIEEVPEEFMYVDMLNNLKGQEGIDWFNSEAGHNKWLSGKMFISKTCRGPILQNGDDTSQLIVFDIHNANDKSASCYSAGYFFDTSKWQVSDKDPYPMGEENSANLPEIKWKGDYRVVERIPNTKGVIISIVLVNKETYDLKGEADLDQIISTFKFNN